MFQPLLCNFVIGSLLCTGGCMAVQVKAHPINKAQDDIAVQFSIGECFNGNRNITFNSQKGIGMDNFIRQLYRKRFQRRCFGWTSLFDCLQFHVFLKTHASNTRPRIAQRAVPGASQKWRIFCTSKGQKKIQMNKVLVALLAGIAVGILIAPEKGSETRKKLKAGLLGLVDDLSDLKDKYLPGEDRRVWEKAFGDKRMSSYV